MNMHYVLVYSQFKTKYHIQAKAVQQTVIYKLSIETLEKISMQAQKLKDSIENIRQEMVYFDNQRNEWLYEIPALDYIVCLHSHRTIKQNEFLKYNVRKSFKSAVIKTILNLREKAARGTPKIKHLVRNVKAYLANEQQLVSGKIKEMNGLEELKQALGLKMINEANQYQPAHKMIQKIQNGMEGLRTKVENLNYFCTQIFDDMDLNLKNILDENS